MKSQIKISSKLIIFGIVLVFSSAFLNLNKTNNTRYPSECQELSIELPNEKPSTSGFWTVSFICIFMDNWSDPCDYVQQRAGTLADPHIIENVTVDATYSPFGVGILILDCDDYFIIRNCTVLNTANSYGAIDLGQTTHGKIENNTCRSNNGYGIRAYTYSYNNTIFNNKIYDNEQTGIYLFEYSYNNTILNNTISDNKGDGIWLEDCNNNTIFNNTIKNNGEDGIWLDWSDNNTIFNNTISNNGWDGIWLTDSDNNKMYNNTISNNDYAVYLEDSSNNKVYNNKFIYNNRCIVEEGTCIGNILSPNICILKPSTPSDDDDDDDDDNTPAIPGYDLLIISFSVLILSGTLTLILIKKKMKC